MPAPLSPTTPPLWRVAGVAAVCAAAGGGLRWSLRETTAAGRSPDIPAAVAPTAAPLPDAQSLRTLSVNNRLIALVAALPGMSTAEIAALVESLAAQVPEGGSGAGTPGVELLLRVAFTRWAELDALEAPAYQYALTTRMIAVSVWAELRGLAALEAVKTKWPGIAGRVAWEVLERRPEQMTALIPLLDSEMMPNKSYSDSDHVLYNKLGPERWVHLAAAMGQIGYVWGEMRDLGPDDFPRALQIAKSLPSGNAREAALGTVLEFLNPHYDLYDSVKASGVSFRTEFEALPPGRARDELSKNYAYLLAQVNTKSALAWARALPNGEVRRESIEYIALAIKLGRTDATSLTEAGLLPDELPASSAGPAPPPSPEQARAETLAALIKGGVKDEAWAVVSAEDRRFLAAEVIRARLLQVSSEEAVKLFQALSPEERTLGAWYEAGRAQIMGDEAKASQWVAALPPGPERDAAATALVEHLSGVDWTGGYSFGNQGLTNHPDYGNPRDGEAAFTWAASMSGEAERTRYLTQAAKAWALDDAAATRAAVAASALPDAEKEYLLHQLPEGGAQ